MTKIYELPTGYRIFRKYIKYTYREYFDEITITGIENIPVNAPVIYAPNHLNALMDALGLSLFFPYNQSTTYLARADVFRNKYFSKILTFTKIIPAFRIRDGYENLGKNAETFEMCKEILNQKQNLCIMPEGNQEIERNVRPLVKGIFRVAFAAQEETEHEIFIVPVGYDYEDLINYGKNLIINIGKPIGVKSYMNAYAENQVKTTNELRNRLRNALIDLTIHIDTKENYECFEMAFETACTVILAEKKQTPPPTATFLLRKEIARKLSETEKTDPGKTERLKKLSTDFKHLSKKLKVNAQDIKYLYKKPDNSFFSLLKLIILFPLFVTGFVLNALPFYTPFFVRKKAGVKFKGFYSSVYYVSSIVSFPIFYFLQSLIINLICGCDAWLFFALLPVHYFTGKLAYYGWYRPFSDLRSYLKIKKISQKFPDDYESIKALTNEIVSILKPAK